MSEVKPSIWLYWLIRKIVRMLFKLFFGLKVYGIEHVPAKGGVIFAPNHASHLDPPAVAVSSPRRLRFMAKIELFKPFLFGKLIAKVGSFPVRRGGADIEAIKTALNVLKSGEALLIFPEGQRSPDGYLQTANTGIGMLAKNSKCPVVPTAIVGTRQALPPGVNTLRRSKVRVYFGEPLLYSEVIASAGDKEPKQYFADVVMQRIRAMLEEAGVETTSTTEVGNDTAN